MADFCVRRPKEALEAPLEAPDGDALTSGLLLLPYKELQACKESALLEPLIVPMILVVL